MGCNNSRLFYVVLPDLPIKLPIKTCTVSAIGGNVFKKLAQSLLSFWIELCELLHPFFLPMMLSYSRRDGRKCPWFRGLTHGHKVLESLFVGPLPQ